MNEIKYEVVRDSKEDRPYIQLHGVDSDNPWAVHIPWQTFLQPIYLFVDLDIGQVHAGAIVKFQGYHACLTAGCAFN